MERSHVYGVELSRLRSLSGESQPLRKIHFCLESDALPARDSYLDLYVPEFHQYGSNRDRLHRHLDTTSIWRKLSAAQAEELKFWEEMFAAVLEYIVSNHLIDIVDDMDNCHIDRYPGDLDGRICNFINKLESQNITVNVREIITYMLELYKRHGCQRQWLAASGNFYNALCEFLRTRDCFEDAEPHPTVNVSFSASLSDRGPAVVGILKRYAPLMKFKRLDVFTSEEGWCEIRPSYTEPILDPSYTSIIEQPEYRLLSDWIKFDWDKNVEGFRGYVRPLPDMGDREIRSCLNVDLATTSKRFFPTKVIFERHIRVRIQLSVCRTTSIRLSLSPDSEKLQAQQPYPKERPFIHPLPSVQDLGEVMKSYKRSVASSPTKPMKKKKTAKAAAKAPFFYANPRWGRNVPAWEMLPSPDLRVEHQKDYDNSANDFEATDDEYIIVHQPHTIPSSCDLNGSDAPLEMKPTTKGGRSSPPKQSSHFNVTHYPGVSVSPEPARAKTPVCPASAPPCPPRRHRRVDSMLGISISSGSNEKRPVSSAVWVTLDGISSMRKGSGYSTVDDATYFRWSDNNGNVDGNHWDIDVVDAAAGADADAASAVIVPTAASPSHMEEQASTEWYRQHGDLDKLESNIETFRQNIKEWYDSMVLKKDTPCRRTKDDLSQEFAFQEAFLLGGESGDDGDAEGDD